MKPSVYIETSVLSALVDDRQDPVSKAQRVITQDWWDTQRRNYRLFSSEFLIMELKAAEFPGQAAALARTKELILFPATPETEGLAQVYQDQLVMPQGDVGDAAHLAVACLNEVDYLLTWNCKHLANPRKIRHIQVVNMRMGLLTPILITPQMLWVEETDK